MIRQPTQKNAPSDADLIERSRREPGCFAGIFDRHGKEILRYAHARLGPDQAEDIVAETFLAAFRRRDRYDTSHADARPWLYGIAIRLISRQRRAEVRYRQMLQSVPVEMFAEDFGDRSAERATAERLRPQLLAVLGGLPVRDRELLLLVAIVVPVLLPGGTPASVVTKAWAVQRNPDGTVTVRISQFAFATGLAQTLKADGVPALIRFREVHDPPPTGPLTSPTLPACAIRWPAARRRWRSRRPLSGCISCLVPRRSTSSSSFTPRPCRPGRCCT